jgi:hypothetical protein
VPVVYGVARSIEIASGMAAAAAALGTLALGRLQPSWLGTGLFVASLALAARVYGGLFRARARVQRPEALAAHKLLVVERLLLAGAFTAARAPCLAAGLLGVAIPISAVLQARMRDRHEQTS